MKPWQLAQSGAEVIRRLLEQNELKSKEIDRYLGLLAARYQQVNSDSEEGLRVGLLGTKSGLCAESAYKDKSAKRFKLIAEKLWVRLLLSACRATCHVCDLGFETSFENA